VGIISRDRKVVDGVIKVFEEDWAKAASPEGVSSIEGDIPAGKATRKAVKAISKELPPVAPILEEALRDVVGNKAEVSVDAKRVEESVRGAIKEAVKEAVEDAVEEIVEKSELNHGK
jgi:hypothetical protein